MLLLKYDAMLAALIITVSQGDDFVAEHLRTKLLPLISRLFQGLWW